MKKLIYICVPMVLVLLIVAGSGLYQRFTSMEETPAEVKGVTFLDGEGKTLLQTKTVSDIYETEQWAYLELAYAEAVQLIAQQEKCSEEEAGNRIMNEGYRIQTMLDSAAFEALKSVADKWGSVCNTATAITDLNGSVLAVFSTDTENKKVNYSRQRCSPHSSFKPLSVYTPAIENGKANWSSLYHDSAYKQLEDGSGVLRDWPTNASGKYSDEYVTVQEAIRVSLNTVAVKCLKDLGVQESVDFLQKSFDAPLEAEAFTLEQYGADEVIGSIALGSLEAGVTPVEMAGYYQIFATGGMYTKPATVRAICREDGTAIYTWQASPRQVVGSETADIMNKLLQGVVSAGGTGELAACEGIEIAGKTGTGDDFEDNWFVGVTPGYCLAVWHGQAQKNQADEMFASVIGKLYSDQPDANRKFITHKSLKQAVYCVRSGKAISDHCTLIDIGYYANPDELTTCDKCK